MKTSTLSEREGERNEESGVGCAISSLDLLSFYDRREVGTEMLMRSEECQRWEKKSQEKSKKVNSRDGKGRKAKNRWREQEKRK